MLAVCHCDVVHFCILQEQYDYLYRLAERATEWTPPPTAELNNNVTSCSEDTEDIDTPVQHSAELLVEDDEEKLESYDERL